MRGPEGYRFRIGAARQGFFQPSENPSNVDNPGRRKLLRAFGIATLAVVADIATGGRVIKGLANVIGGGAEGVAEKINGPTDAQRTAADFWKISGEDDFVHNIEAIGDTDKKGNVIPVKLRNKPELSGQREPAADKGKIIGEINPPFSIDKALVVRGDDLMGAKNEGLWFIILNPKNPNPNDPNNFFFAEHLGFKFNGKEFVEVPRRSLDYSPDGVGLSITSVTSK